MTVPRMVSMGMLAAIDDAGMPRRVGCVGTGWMPDVVRDLRRRVDKRKTCRNPCSALCSPRDRGVQYLEPVAVAEETTRGWMDREVRGASFRGLRDDKPACQVLLKRPVDRQR